MTDTPLEAISESLVSPSPWAVPEQLALLHALRGLLIEIATAHERDDARNVNELYDAVIFVGWRLFELGKVPLMEETLDKAAIGLHRDEMLDAGINAWYYRHDLAKKKHPWGKSKFRTKPG